MDLSLDEIIKKKNIKKGAQQPRGRSINGSGVGRNIAPGRNAKPINGRVGKPSRRPLSSGNSVRGIVDARMKIIQKNRQRLTDARDKLSELAKRTDARTRIKGKNLKMNQQVNPRRMNRTDYNRINSQNAPVMLQRSIRNNIVANIRDPSNLIRCTINRPITDFSVRPTYVDNMEMPLPMRPRNDLSSIKVVTQNEYTHNPQEYLPNIPEPMYEDPYEPQMFPRYLDPGRSPIVGGAGGRMSQEMRARLDSPAKASLYNYPPASHSPPPSQGHRIVVSNLHASVTHEDIKELFEDIGPLVTSRLVRAGTAEVIYKLQKDAKKAVEAYHNRQLDGQPMKCLLVNPRSPLATGGVLRSSNMPVIPKFPSSSKSMVVPDLSAIHKALFTSK